VPKTPVRLSEHGFSLIPRQLARLRGAAEQEVAYADVARLTMTEPHGLRRGRLEIHLVNRPAPVVVEFVTAELVELRSAHREIWARVNNARGESGATDVR